MTAVIRLPWHVLASCHSGVSSQLSERKSVVKILPPILCVASKIVTSLIPLLRRVLAADNPEIPAPIIATFGDFFASICSKKSAQLVHLVFSHVVRGQVPAASNNEQTVNKQRKQIALNHCQLNLDYQLSTTDWLRSQKFKVKAKLFHFHYKIRRFNYFCWCRGCCQIRAFLWWLTVMKMDVWNVPSFCSF